MKIAAITKFKHGALFELLFVLSRGELHQMSVVDAVRLWRVRSGSVLIYPASKKEFRALQERVGDNRRRTSKGILRLLKKLRGGKKTHKNA